jgi:hypothetical protein
MYVLYATEMNSHRLKDRRDRVSDTMGLENVCPVLAHLLRTPDTIETIRRKLNQDDTRPTENNNTPTTDFQICSNNQESK